MFKTSSPYITLFRDNIIQWQPFSRKTLDYAQGEDKLIFVHIGGIGNIKDRESALELFSNEEVAQVINANFTPILIDEEDYPESYLLGWDILQINNESKKNPINLFLMPDFTPITSTSSCYTEEILMLLENLVAAFNFKRNALSGMAEEAKKMIGKSSVVSEKGKQVNIDCSILERYVEDWSPYFANFCNFSAKESFCFKTPSLLFLTEYFEKEGDMRVKNFLVTVIRKILDSPISDPIEGGIFSCMEKRLYDNLMIALFMAKAYNLFGEECCKRYSLGIIGFIENNMKSSEGGYFSSITFDNLENAFNHYGYSVNGLRNLFGERWREIALSLGINPDLDENAIQLPSASSAAELFSKDDLEILKLTRKEEKGMIKDMRKITSNNALTTSILCLVSDYLGGIPKLIELAIENHQFIKSNMCSVGNRMVRYSITGNSPEIEGNLTDYAEMIQSDIRLYYATNEDYYLSEARNALKYVLENFYNRENGMFFKSSKYSYLIPLKRESNIDGNKASNNSIMCSNLLEMYNITENKEYLEIALQQFYNIIPHLLGSGAFMSNWARQLMRYMELCQ